MGPHATTQTVQNWDGLKVNAIQKSTAHTSMNPKWPDISSPALGSFFVTTQTLALQVPYPVLTTLRGRFHSEDYRHLRLGDTCSECPPTELESYQEWQPLLAVEDEHFHQGPWVCIFQEGLINSAICCYNTPWYWVLGCHFQLMFIERLVCVIKGGDTGKGPPTLCSSLPID
jgi:hypothetical protein